MTSTTYLGNHFLIAMPSLTNPYFFQTVTYICEHDSSGALGIVINRPLQLTVGELLEHLEIPSNGDSNLASTPVYFGGPVQQEQGFVVHTPIGDWDATLKITDTLGITTSRDILEAIGDGRGPSRSLIALGYAGWGQGQLEQEMAENTWLSGPADNDILFDSPDKTRWAAAAELLGVDLNLLSSDTGHA